jgi:hypothetical protein
MAPETKVNGINIDQLFSTIDLLKEKPELAKCKFRATNKWIDGAHSRATVKDFMAPARKIPPGPPCHMTWMNRRSSWGLIMAPIPWSIFW